MPATSQSEYQRAAKLRWPSAFVHGDGPFAVYCPVRQAVDLYGWAMAAMSAVSVDCSNWRCKATHLFHELKPVYPHTNEINRIRSLIERD